MRAISVFNVIIGIVAGMGAMGLGLAASVGVGELLAAAFADQNNQRDFMALLLVAPIVLIVTFLAAYIPARRASHIDPMTALRYE